MSKQLPVFVSVNNKITFEEINETLTMPVNTTPSTPSAGFANFFISNNSLFFIDENGITHSVGDNMILPPSGTSNSHRLLSGYLGTSGLDAGNTSLNVDGSTTPEIFFIESNANYDIYITEIYGVIADSKVSTFKIGNIKALTAGIDLIVTEEATSNYFINKAKTFGEILTQVNLLDSPFGSGGSTNMLPNTTSGSDSQIFKISWRNYLPYGIRLGRGNLDKIECVINDNLTGLNDFTIKINGFKNY